MQRIVCVYPKGMHLWYLSSPTPHLWLAVLWAQISGRLAWEQACPECTWPSSSLKRQPFKVGLARRRLMRDREPCALEGRRPMRPQCGAELSAWEGNRLAGRRRCLRRKTELVFEA